MTELAHDLYLLVAVLGLAPAVRLAGLPVLAGSAFAAVGGVGALQLERAGLPIGGAALLAIALGGMAGALLGALVARAEPAFVALSTWALAWLAYVVLLGFPSLSGGGQGLTRPALDTVETPLGLTLTLTPRVHVVAAAVLCVLAYAGSAWFARTPTGLGAVAARDDDGLARSLSIGGGRVESLAFAGAAAAAAGAGAAVLLGVAAPADVSPLLALQLFAAALAATRNPLLGVAVIVALPHVADWLTAVLLLAAVAVRVRGAAPSVPVEAGAAELPATAEGLDARDLRVTLGGREILRGLDLAVRPGEIHALIGPNGSGKTTALGALGVVRTFQRDAGFPALTPLQQLALLDEERAATYLALVGLAGRGEAGRSEPRRWRAALARGVAPRGGETAPPDEASPRGEAAPPGETAPPGGTAPPGETAPLGETAPPGGTAPAGKTAPRDETTPPGEAGRSEPRGWRAALARGEAGRGEPRGWRAARAALSPGDAARRSEAPLDAAERRLLAVALAAATGAPVLAFDEPAAGLSHAQRETLTSALRSLAESGRAILVVEHDLRLVAAIADVVTVLDEGVAIAHGSPGDVTADETVQRVYLGAAA